MRLIAILCALIIWMSVGIKPLASDYLYATYIHSKEKDQAIQYLKYAIAADKGDTNKLAELARQYMRQKNFPNFLFIFSNSNFEFFPLIFNFSLLIFNFTFVYLNLTNNLPQFFESLSTLS